MSMNIHIRQVLIFKNRN